MDDRKYILDACCGSRMFWFDRSHANTVYMDKRELQTTLCDGRKLEIKPDVVGDFTNMPFADESFYMVIFDPPHLIHAGDKSWLASKYGKLEGDWKEELKKGFEECFRVLKTFGSLIFKWNDEQVNVTEILKLSPMPLIGNQRGKTHFMVFMKIVDVADHGK